MPLNPSLTKIFLKFIDFKDFKLWDVKRYFANEIFSSFPMVSLGNYIQEENKKYKLFEEPEKNFGILGVNNKNGIFDAYTQKGKEINQAYKKIKTGWLAYNPYRINVGSIGIRKKEHKNEYISPAYVAFSCKENLLPEFLFLVFKTKIFNQVINDNTTGSVRQNLTIDILKSLKIPLPLLSEQEKIVQNYYEKVNRAKKLERQAQEIEIEIEEYFLRELGLQSFELKQRTIGLQMIDFTLLERWDVFSTDTRVTAELKKSKFELVSIGKVFQFAKRSFNKSKYKNKTFSYIEIGAIDHIKGIVEVKKIETKNAPSRATQFVKAGDLIIGTTRPYLKKFVIVPNQYDGNVCSSGFSIIQPSDAYDLSFLYQFLNCFYGIEQLKNKMTGGLYPAIAEAELKKIKIPFPTIETQNLIMNIIEKKKNNILNNQYLAQKLKHQADQEFEEIVFCSC